MNRNFTIKTGQGVVSFRIALNQTGLYVSCEPEFYSPFYIPYAGHLEKLSSDSREILVDAVEAGLRMQYEVK